MRSMELEYGGLCKALLAKKRVRNPVPGARESGGPAGPTGVLTTLRGGTGRLSDALVQAMATSIQRNRPVRALTRQDHRLTVWCDGSKECFDAVVVAVPAHQAAGMIEGLAPRAARSLEQIEFANVVVVCHMYDADTLGIKLDGFGHLIPRRDGIRALGCLWTSCIFPGQALDGKVLLRTIFGGTHDPTVVDLPDEQLVRLVVESTAATLGISTKPHLTRIYRHRQGIPQYTLGHRQRVAEVDRLGDEMPNLAFVGASYRGASLNRCIRDAYTIAPRVLEPFGVRLAPVPVS
jgi:oxygen-dependent protoporphyrinogen oxidase